MEITVNDSPSSTFLQDLKWYVVGQGYQYTKSEQPSKNTVKMFFEKLPCKQIKK